MATPKTLRSVKGTELTIAELDNNFKAQQDTVIGRVSTGEGIVEELTATQVRTLINVEDGADVTDATNVTAAGALMDSEVTNLAQVKAFDATDYATAAQGTLADSATQPGDDADTLGSGAATDGQVLTADGLGGAAWEAAAGGGATFGGVSVTDVAAGTNVTFADDGDGTITMNVSSGTATLGDGDYGDVTVSGTGTVITVDNGAISNAKLADVATSTIKGRVTAATGDPEDLTAAQVRTLLNVADGANATPSASTTVAGAVELATNAETVTGTDTTRAVTPDGLTDRLAAPGTIGGTTPGAGIFSSLTVGGETITALADPNADRILFWDDSAGSTAYLTVGTGLDLTETTLTSTGYASGGTDVAIADGGTGASTALGAVNGLSAGMAPVALTDGATITPDFSAGRNFKVTLAGNRTLANPTNQVAGYSGRILVTQDATGSRTLSYGANWLFNGGAPTLSTAANAVDLIVYDVEASGTIYATWLGAFSA